MQVSVEAPSKLERRVSIVVPAEKLDEAFDKRIVQLSKTANVKGFRPGKVPLNYVKQHYGDTARQEAISEIIQSAVYDAIKQENLNPVAAPVVEPKNITPGQPLEFVAIFEIFPVIDNINFSVKALEKQVATVGTEDIALVIDHLRNQQVTWKKVDRAAQDKDQVTIDFSGKIDGEVFQGGEAHDYPIVIGSKTMLPGFEEGLVGTTTGQEKTISINFPDNYFAKEVAGKTAEFAIKVHKICEPVLPELNADFIKKLGIKSGTLEDLNAEIQKNLTRECERVIKSKLKNQVFETLLAQNEIEVPKALVEQEAHRIHHEMHPHHRGQDHNHSPEEMATFNDAARRSVILGLLVAEFAKQNKITPDKNRVHAHITNIAAAYENPAEIIEWYANNKQRIAEVEMQILEEQIMEKLLEGVNITEKSMKYSDLIAR